MPDPVIPPGARTLSVLPTGPAHVPGGRKPPWLKVKASLGPNYRELRQLMRDSELHTVCEEAGCPNIFECWEAREATFLIGGEDCTRNCPFCQIHTARPKEYDTDEPRRVAHAVARMGLNFAVITGVARDDLDDGGAWLFAESVRQVRELLPTCGVEVLIPDFRGKPEHLRVVTDARPDVLGHNLETVPRLYRRIRPGFRYERSLELLARARAWLPAGHATKSNLILGMGEQREEVVGALHDLREAGVELLTITQYLQPTQQHLAIDRYVHPDEFAEWKSLAEALGFVHVESGPLVRSSYHAGEMHKAAVRKQRGELPGWAVAAGG
ncbi:MAG TPA: lipoyl synthase [Actinomycetes bacterium]